VASTWGGVGLSGSFPSMDIGDWKLERDRTREGMVDGSGEAGLESIHKAQIAFFFFFFGLSSTPPPTVPHAHPTYAPDPL